ncbi:MAG: T9SS type A sorting domain-containing protein [Bacteroidales bacterium]|nr:T9SS type A sorting domain-containing protein [Bacteroidales bacterium]MDD3151396.1 T9SS type A sorting domain-containing protein [Bacteroidales bacterium]MDD3913421.1 T9SS type A sorting domain-containing protein [Bacteroidales bacterium]MDD4633217.1 T9SS type A sorting domain-containing protein [Bacteroidales bacterium]
MSKNLLCCFIVLFACSFSSLYAQISHGGYPYSFAHSQICSSKTVVPVKADLEYMQKNMEEVCKDGCRRHVGFFIDADYSRKNIIDNVTAVDGDNYVYIISFYIAEAKAVGISFSDIKMSPNASLFVYNKDLSDVLGSFNTSNVLEDNTFTISPVKGDVIILEYNCNSKQQLEDFDFTIDGFSYFFYDVFADDKDSGLCNVNINCPEGSSVRVTANAVMRLYILASGKYYLCTGTLMNNTLQNREPYVLTAWHCAQETKKLEFAKWIFYFDYEDPYCEPASEEPEKKSLIGCYPIAYSENYNVILGSDFYLLKLIDSVIPEDYNAYFSGWDVSGDLESTAKSVHHPNGDVKKVSSAYNISESPWNSGSLKMTHWKVYWQETESGHGVTEGGSSGSPLIDAEGNVIGTLTGGNSSCDTPNSADYYGKLSYSWTSNGNDSINRLDCWLDPTNSGVTELQGYTDNLTISDIAYSINNSSLYSLYSPNVLVGDEVSFQTNFFGNPDSCLWYFEGGEPSYSSLFQPENVLYKSAGIYDVSITLYKSGVYPKIIMLQDFIRVTPILYPNPFEDKITVVLDETIGDETLFVRYAQLVDVSGKVVCQATNVNHNYNVVTMCFSDIKSGYYVLQLKTDNKDFYFKVLKK